MTAACIIAANQVEINGGFPKSRTRRAASAGIMAVSGLSLFFAARFQLQEPSPGINLVVTIKFYSMPNAGSQSSSANDLLKNSSLYREFQAEREEILKHKWIESEKAGRDIGFEQALTDWIIKHRASWRKNRQAAAAN